MLETADRTSRARRERCNCDGRMDRIMELPSLPPDGTVGAVVGGRRWEKQRLPAALDDDRTRDGGSAQHAPAIVLEVETR